MNAALHTYSGILQLRRDAIAAALGSPHGIAYSLRLFVIVLLIAGLGIWFGLPATLRQPTLTEQVDKVTSQVRDAGLNVVARVIPMVTDVKDIPRTVANYLEQYAGPYVRMFGNLTGRLSTDVGDANQLLKQANVSTNEVMQLVQTTQVTPEQLGQLLARTNATPEQIQMIAVAANLALPQVQDQVRANLSTSAQNAISELQPMLKKLSMTAEQLQQTLALLSTTPEQFNDLRKALSLTSDQLGEFLVMLKATPERLNQLAVQIHNETVKMEPAVGAGPSRVRFILLASGCLRRCSLRRVGSGLCSCCWS